MSNGRESGGVFDLQTTGSASTPFRPIKLRRAFDEISGEIKRLIFKGILKPGDRLPSETELASQFGVGRQTIREALRLLELSGFISMQKGGAGGPLVVDTILNTISNSFLDAFQMGRITIDELTLARLAIEKMVLESLFARNPDEADIQALRQNVSQARKKIEAGIQPFEENTQFHKLLARASKNHLFLILMESIMTVVAHFRSILGVTLELSVRSVAAHEQTIDALVKGNRKKAFLVLEVHLMELGERFKELAGTVALLNKRTEEEGL
ncbi:MAG TPA: GntR family transcriptional regulator [Syntrophorhabdales bacterium]|nr:GntR family transcriptional regulator [Syntrophorhabdales bacterium]